MLPPIEFKGQVTCFECEETSENSEDVVTASTASEGEGEFNLMESTAYLTTRISNNLFKYTMLSNIRNHLNPNRMDVKQRALLDFTNQNLAEKMNWIVGNGI